MSSSRSNAGWMAIAILAGVLPATDPAPAAIAPDAAHRDQPIRIGLIAQPGLPGDDESLLAGALRAAGRVNTEGGVNGLPVEVIPLAAPRPWRDGAAAVARLVHDHHLIALAGATRGETAHVAAQIATRARIPLITTTAEPGLMDAKVPWIFQVVPDDATQARALLEWAHRREPIATAYLVVPGGRTGRESAAALRAACDAVGIEVASVLPLDLPANGPGILDPASTGTGRSGTGAPLEDICDRTRGAGPEDAVLIWLDPEPAAPLLRCLSGSGGGPRRIGPLRLNDRVLFERARGAIDGLILPGLGAPPEGVGDTFSSIGHDLVIAVVQAARSGGGGPRHLRDALASAGRFGGESGDFRFDATGRREGPLPIGVVRLGRWNPDPTVMRPLGDTSPSISPASAITITTFPGETH